MSEREIQRIKCPKCGGEHDFEIWTRVNTDLDPILRDRIKSGELFRTVCPICGQQIDVVYPCLYHEMEKLISYCDPGAEITDTAIREVCSRELKDTIFQLTAAIAQRQREAAFKAYRDLVGLETKPSQILYMLRREFKLVWMVKALTSQGQSPSEIARKARIHPAFINRYMNVQAAFDEAQLLSVTDELTEIQALTHTGRADARFALESFMMKHTDE